MLIFFHQNVFEYTTEQFHFRKDVMVGRLYSRDRVLFEHFRGKWEREQAAEKHIKFENGAIFFTLLVFIHDLFVSLCCRKSRASKNGVRVMDA